MHWEVLIEIMDSEMTGIALFSEGRRPEENRNYASQRRSIFSASTSKRVHAIFDLYPTKNNIKKSTYHWCLCSDRPLDLSTPRICADGTNRIFLYKCNAEQRKRYGRWCHTWVYPKLFRYWLYAISLIFQSEIILVK